MHRVFIAVILLMSLLLSGCQQQQKQETEITVCSSMESKATAVLADDFTNKTGIKVKIIRLPAGSFNERIEFIRKNNVDCWLGGTVEEYYLASQQNLLQPYLTKEAYKVPAAMRSKEGYWTSLYLEYVAFISNKDRLHELGLYAPDTCTELLKPQLRGEIVIPDYIYGGASYGLLTSIWQLRGRQQALQYAAELNKQHITYTDHISDAVDMVYTGRKTVAVLPLRYALKLEERYNHLFATVVEDANRNLLTGAAVINGSKQQQEACRFIDYLMSDDSLQVLSNNGYQYLWHVKDYPHNNLRKELLGNVRVPVDDLSWTAIEKNEIIRQWLSAGAEEAG